MHISLRIFLVLLAATLLSACGPDGAPHHQLELSGHTMGTTYSVKLVDAPENLDQAALQKAIDIRLADINKKMSTYDPESELSRFNRYQRLDWFTVSPETVKLVAEAHQVSETSDGIFDVTIGPLVDIWGFGPPKTGDAVPSEQSIEQARALVGYKKLETRDNPPALRKHLPGLRVDLSAIAKGYGVDAISDLLSREKLHNHLVEIGGELRGKGYNARGVPWRIGVEKPGPGFKVLYTAMNLSDRGMATSGDYRNFFEKDGRRYSHTIDPRSGQPVTHSLTSVTVLADSCMRADALATALLASGPNKAYALAEQEGIAALFIERTDDGFSDRSSSAMQALMPAHKP